MKIAYSVGQRLLANGKPAICFRCEDCNRINISGHIARFFYMSNLDSSDLEKSLQEFTDAINNHNVESLFTNKKIAKKVYRCLCKCKPKNADIDSGGTSRPKRKIPLLSTGGKIFRFRKSANY